MRISQRASFITAEIERKIINFPIIININCPQQSTLLPQYRRDTLSASKREWENFKNVSVVLWRQVLNQLMMMKLPAKMLPACYAGVRVSGGAVIMADILTEQLWWVPWPHMWPAPAPPPQHKHYHCPPLTRSQGAVIIISWKLTRRVKMWIKLEFISHGIIIIITQFVSQSSNNQMPPLLLPSKIF